MIRNFQMHIYPVRNSLWKWNCDEVLRRASLFTGKRIVAIATDAKTDSAWEVKEYLKDFTDTFIEVTNDPKQREVLTFIPMLEMIESLEGVTFCCHSKGVRDQQPADRNQAIRLWTQAMYDTCLDYWPVVESILSQKAMAGSFRRFGQFRTPGNNRWHYSGTFYWFRNRDVFLGNWRHVDEGFYGTESWPGLMFTGEQTGCIFLDDAKDMYDIKYWNTITPALNQWKAAHKHNLTNYEELAANRTADFPLTVSLGPSHVPIQKP